MVSLNEVYQAMVRAAGAALNGSRERFEQHIQVAKKYDGENVAIMRSILDIAESGEVVTRI